VVLSVPDEGVVLSAGVPGALGVPAVSTALDEGASDGAGPSVVDVVSDIQGLADPAMMDQQRVMPLCCVCV
jgi:hypothetical protein